MRVLFLLSFIICTTVLSSCTKELDRPSLNTKRLQFSPGKSAIKLQVDASGNIYILGLAPPLSSSGPANISATWLAKLDKNGNLLWEKELISAPSGPAELLLTSDNELIALGYKAYFKPGPRVNFSVSRNVLLRLDLNGNLLNSRIVPDSTDEDMSQIYHLNWYQNQLISANYNPNTFEIDRFKSFNKQFDVIVDTNIVLNGINADYSGPSLMVQGFTALGKANITTVRFQGNQFVKNDFELLIPELADWEVTVSGSGPILGLGDDEHLVTDIFAAKNGIQKHYLLSYYPAKGDYWIKSMPRFTLMAGFKKDNNIHLYYDIDGVKTSSIWNVQTGEAIPFQSTMSANSYFYVTPQLNNRMIGVDFSGQLNIWDEYVQ